MRIRGVKGPSKPKPIVIDTSKAQPRTQRQATSLPPVTHDVKQSMSVLAYGKEAMTRYGLAVIEDRALPDYRDGWKPVHRKILWSMHRLGLTSGSKHKKSARIVGDVLGKYHPHSDSATYGAMVTMANSPMPTVDGDGNWGNITDNAAAYRYTNARLSAYADNVMFHKHYSPVTELVPNFDGSEKEPLVLNNLLPNAILNGSYGIGVAITSCVPSFHPDGVRTLLQLAFSGTKITPALCLKHLEFNYPYGGECISDDKTLLNFYATGEGRIQFESQAKFDPSKRRITFTGFAPNINLEKTLERVSGFKFVSDAMDNSSMENGNCAVVILAKVPQKDYNACVDKVIAEFDSALSFKMNFIERYIANANRDVRARLLPTMSLPVFFDKWCTWRLSIETASLKFRLAKCQSKVDYLGLLILAIRNKPVLKQSLDEKDPVAFLATKLKIKPEQAQVIFNEKLWRYTKLSEAELLKDIAETQRLAGQLQSWLKNPAAKIAADLKALQLT